MRQFIIIAILLMTSLFASAQDETIEASYPGGNDALMTMIMNNLRYPKDCFMQDVQGKVIVKFKVKKDGSIGNAAIVDSPHKSMSDETLRIVSLFPKWIPAKKDGQAIASEVTLPVTFRLASSNEKKVKTISCAEKPETIETFAANSHEAEWYGAQALAWQKVVDENPKDEWAWRNLFRATYYHDMFTGGLDGNQDESRSADVLRKMETTLPNTFVLNLSKCRFCLTPDTLTPTSEFIHRALKLMPENVNAEDVNYLACRLWGYDPENSMLQELSKATYRNKYFPDRILRYNWNMLKSMEADALYFSNGDILTSPMKVLQDAIGERTDVSVIPLSFLFIEEFRNSLCKQLGIKPINVKLEDYWKKGDKWDKQFYTDIITYLMRQSRRPTYFSTDLLSFTNFNRDNLYNEGMLLKYSDVPYNNFAVAMHNVKEVYHMEYLTEPDIMYNSWETSGNLDMNYITLLSNLVSKLRKNGEMAESQRLYGILKKCAERCHKDPKVKELIMSKLEAEK